MNLKPTPPQAMFLAIIGELPASSANPWSASTEQMFLIGLRSIPDEGLPKLCEAVLDRCRFRPSVHEIKDLWQKLTSPLDALTPAGLVASLAERVRNHGAHGMPHPTLRNCFLAGAPPDLTEAESAVVATWGGWGPFCEDESPVGVRRGQMLKVAEMVISGGEGEGLRRLRLEYQEQQGAHLISGATEEYLLLGENENPLGGEDNHSSDLTRFGGLTLPSLK